MSLSTLPDLCLLSIFDRIPLQQVNSLGEVCQRWSTLQPIVYKRRRSLILLISSQLSDSSVVEYHFEQCYCTLLIRNPFEKCVAGYVDERKFIAQRKFSLLTYSTLDEVNTNWLIGTFSNITNLAILHDDRMGSGWELEYSNEITQLIALLNHWSDKLKSLHYFQCGFRFIYSPELFDVINSLSALKHLWLELHSNNSYGQSKFDLPVLAQLDQLYIYWDFADLTHIFQKYASVMNSNLKIAIGNFSSNRALDKFCKFDCELARKFVECSFDFDLDLTQHFYPKFTSLTKVSVKVIKLSQLCLSLSSLKNLDILNMCSDESDLAAENELPSSTFLSLTSVRTLQFAMSLNSHLDLNSIHLTNIFPSVRWIYMSRQEGGGCDICDIDYDDCQSEMQTNKRYQSCFQQLVQPFRMLPKLEKIVDCMDLD